MHNDQLTSRSPLQRPRGATIVERSGGVELIAARQANGQYLLAGLMPVLCAVGGSPLKDLYVAHGDPVGVRNVCQAGFTLLSDGLALRRYEAVRLRIKVEVVGEPWMIGEVASGE